MFNILTLPTPAELPHEVQPEEFKSFLDSTRAVTWVRCLSPTDADLLWLQGTFGFHPLTIEDCRHRNQRPKFEPYDGYAFMVLFTLSWQSDTLDTNEIHCFLTSHCLITVEDRDSPRSLRSGNACTRRPASWRVGLTLCSTRSLMPLSTHFSIW
jgi:Mg2+ and Co2+ transporter CorA